MLSELDKALIRGQNDPEKYEAAYYELFLNTQIFIPTWNVPEKFHKKIFGKNETIQPVIIDFNGHPTVPVFDSEVRFNEWAKGQKVGFVAMRGLDVLETLKQFHLMLNVNSEHYKEFVTEEMEWILSRTKPPPHEGEYIEDKSILSELDKALIRTQKDPEKFEASYYELFLNTQIIIPVWSNMPEEMGERISEEVETFNPVVMDFEGQPTILIFDSEKRVSEWAENQEICLIPKDQEIGFVIMSGTDVLEMLQQFQWLLNINSEYIKHFAFEEIEWILSFTKPPEE